MSVVHEVKCWPAYFDAIERGEKTFDVRRDDRGYQKGDVLELYRYKIGHGYCTDPIDPLHRRKSIRRRISWILTGGQFGIEPGYVVLALQEESKS